MQTWLATESWCFDWSNMTRNNENNALFCAETVENHAICCAENVENHAIFVEGFWPDFYARGRFMKYSMSG